ncbi:MAG: tripartite tricarboxylate transporter permease [Acetobacteraceae bacterium]|nr:tripartite tricarboxylate transporter permease [Acetobacteraceae bacterium]
MSDLLANLAMGFSVAFSLKSLFWCFVGVFLGTFIGVLPGIGPLATISMLLPVTFHLDATSAIIMLAGIYYGANYGGSTASILLNLPGTPSSAVTCLDGYPMAKQGRAGVALMATTLASFIGSSIGILLFTGFAPALAEVGLKFGPAEYFAMMLLGLVAASTVATGAPIKGVAMVVVGVALGLVGTDVQTGQQRFTFGLLPLADGIGLVSLAMGLFGIAEVINSVGRVARQESTYRSSVLPWTRDFWRAMDPGREDWRRIPGSSVRGSAVGSFFGALPGTGPTISAFLSYALEKKIARDPKRFGHGAIEGIASPEAANNAAAQTAFIPTLTLGIPGDVVMALMLGALIIQGIQPGPRLVVEHPQLFWGLAASFWIGNVMLVILNLPLIGIWVAILRIPYSILYPSILVFLVIGVYSVNNSVFDVVTCVLFGVIGYAMNLMRFEPAPLLLGFVLGPLMEEHLRRAMLLARGDPMVFLQRPISATFVAITAALLLLALWSSVKPKRAEGFSAPV